MITKLCMYVCAVHTDIHICVSVQF